jgi:hypothetical protein
LPDCVVAQIDEAMEHVPTIRTRAEFAEYAVLFALQSLNDDAAAIWMGGDAGSELGAVADIPDIPDRV